MCVWLCFADGDQSSRRCKQNFSLPSGPETDFIVHMQNRNISFDVESRKFRHWGGECAAKQLGFHAASRDISVRRTFYCLQHALAYALLGRHAWAHTRVSLVHGQCICKVQLGHEAHAVWLPTGLGCVLIGITAFTLAPFPGRGVYSWIRSVNAS